MTRATGEPYRHVLELLEELTRTPEVKAPSPSRDVATVGQG
jgi:hypothetical protein